MSILAHQVDTHVGWIAASVWGLVALGKIIDPSPLVARFAAFGPTAGALGPTLAARGVVGSEAAIAALLVLVPTCRSLHAASGAFAAMLFIGGVILGSDDGASTVAGRCGCGLDFVGGADAPSWLVALILVALAILGSRRGSRRPSVPQQEPLAGAL